MASNSSIAPDEYHTLTPLLKVKEPLKFIEFLKQVFGAREINQYQQKDRKSIRIDVKIGDSLLIISDFIPELRPMPSAFYIYVDNIDNVYKRALEQGATSLREPKDEIYGNRCAGVTDPFGNQWFIASLNKNASEETYGYNSDIYAESDQTFSV